MGTSMQEYKNANPVANVTVEKWEAVTQEIMLSLIST